jgi:hypothetical protein
MRKQAVKTGGDEARLIPAPFLFNGAMTDVVSRAGEAWTRACLEWQQEVARFANTRLEGDLEHARCLAQCQSVVDLVKLQQKWAAAAVRDYTEETGQLMQIATRAIREGAPEQASAPPASD